MKQLRIDVHIHLAGNGCCESGCWLSPEFQRRPTYLVMRWMQRFSREAMATTVDRDWAGRVSTLVAGAGFDYGVVLGFDGVYHPHTHTLDARRSQMIIPQDWVFRVCREYPHLLPGPSINPYRPRALADLERALADGAVLIKWLPSAQCIDPQDRDLDDFYRLLAAAAVPLLVHTGGERTFASHEPQFNAPSRLVRALDLGVKVIAAHGGTAVRFERVHEDGPASLRQLVQRYDRLWIDNSGICNPARYQHLFPLACDPTLSPRIVYGSDWPVPSHAFYYWRKLGLSQVRALDRIANPIARDWEIKRRAGFDDQTATRAEAILGNLSRWTRQA